MADAFDEVVARLYAVPPEEFIAARTEAAKLARDAGDRVRAVAIAKLRKPTLGAWLVNLLAHERPDLVADLLALGDELRTAQRELRGADLRELSQRRRETVVELARQSRALAIAAGRGVRDTLPLAEVEATLIAALAEPSVADEVRTGTLTRTVEYAGFGETPRPRLTLVQGGRGATAKPESEEADDADEPDEPEGPDEQPPPEKPSKKAVQPAPPARRGDDEPARREQPSRRDETRRDETHRQDTRRQEPGTRRTEPEPETDEDRLAREELRAEAEQKAADRAVAVELRKARAAAHRELLSARTQLAEAEAARTAAERAVLAARRRVEKALARASELDRDGAED